MNESEEHNKDVDSLVQPLSPRVLIRRALRLRCPVCGEGRPYTGLLNMRRDCEKCRFHFEREYGYFLGSIYLNYGPTAILLTVVFFSLLGFFDLRLVHQWPFLLVLAIGFPLLYYRYARLLWLSLDLRFNPPQRREFRTENSRGPDSDK
ncbi:MAG: hypothetical protein MK538_03465 [Planctomycetes bacterium]|nr:hypothetical protein [Planctomycetota bacterium]